jgi:hypothetical protein
VAKLRLGEILIAENKIDQVQLKSALAHQRRWGKKIGDCLVDLGFISELELVRTLSRFLRIPLIDVTRLDSSKITKEILNYLPLPVARKVRSVPLATKEIKRKKRLVIATSDPTNYAAFDEIQFKAGLPLLLMLAPDSDIDWFLRKYYMNDGDALPYNYVSGISLIQDKTAEEISEELEMDPISSIFFDDQFTGVSKTYKDPSRKQSNDDD